MLNSLRAVRPELEQVLPQAIMLFLTLFLQRSGDTTHPFGCVKVVFISNIRGSMFFPKSTLTSRQKIIVKIRDSFIWPVFYLQLRVRRQVLHAWRLPLRLYNCIIIASLSACWMASLYQIFGILQKFSSPESTGMLKNLNRHCIRVGSFTTREMVKGLLGIFQSWCIMKCLYLQLSDTVCLIR